MKMRPEDYEALRTRIKPLDTMGKRESYRIRGLSAKRYRWDLYRESGAMADINKLYEYLNDSHIDTALLRIVKSELVS